MINKIHKLKICAVVTAFIFLFNITGITGLALASLIEQGMLSESSQTFSEVTTNILNTLNLIEKDLFLGNDQNNNLNNLNNYYQELIIYNDHITTNLEASKEKITLLIEQGVVTPEFMQRYEELSVKSIQNSAFIIGGISKILSGNFAGLDILIDKLGVLIDIKDVVIGAKLPLRKSKLPKRNPMLMLAQHGSILPGSEDLATSDVVKTTPEIEEIASSLNHNPTELFLYVRNNFDYQPYYGSSKGSVGTYWEKAGNDFDQASLLIALLRASNIPARYVSGIVGLPIKMVINWVGTNTAEKAIEIFSTNGIPCEPIIGGDNIIGLKFYHVWVEAYNGKWIGMDPSFKQYKYYDGIDIQSVIDVTSIYNRALEGATISDYVSNINTSNLAYDIEVSENTINNYIQDIIPNATVGDVTGYKEITNKAKGLLPPLNNGSVFGISETKERFSEIPESLKYIVNYQLLDINYTASLSDIVGKRVSIQFIPATDNDAAIIQYFGDIFHTPFPYVGMLKMRPVLKINNEIVDTGNALALGRTATLYSGFLGPEETEFSTDTRIITAGATYSLVVDLQKMSPSLLENKVSKLEQLLVGTNLDDTATDEMIEETLNIIGTSWFAETDIRSDLSAKALDVVWTRQPSQAIVTQEMVVSYFFWWIMSVSNGNKTIDVQRNIVTPIGIGNENNKLMWMIDIGSKNSDTESIVFEQLFGIESVSSTRIIAEANRQGIPVCMITEENIDSILPNLYVSALTKDYISQYVGSGFTAICPQRDVTVNDWSGVGFTVIDPNTGASAYLLSGSIINGGSTTKKPKNEKAKGHDVAHFANKTHDLLFYLHLFGKAALYAGVAGYFLADMLSISLLMVFCGGLALITTALMLSYLLQFLVYQLEYVNESRLLRRRRRMFAKLNVVLA